MTGTEVLPGLAGLLATWSEARVSTFWHRRRQFEPAEVPDVLLSLVTRR